MIYFSMRRDGAPFYEGFLYGFATLSRIIPSSRGIKLCWKILLLESSSIATESTAYHLKDILLLPQIS